MSMIGEIVPKNSPWQKSKENPWAFPIQRNSLRHQNSKENLWNLPRVRNRFPRLTGVLRFRRKDSVQNFDNLLAGMDEEIPNCHNQFRQYCDHTSMHGFRYIMQEKRNICERIFWMIWCLFGISGAVYMMSKIWQRWDSNPVITSVATTNFPITNVYFPAVTVCTVNKAVNEKLIIQGCRYNRSLSQMKSIITTVVDPGGRNTDYVQISEKDGVKAETALKFLRLAAPKCDDYLLTCRFNSQPYHCGLMFKLILTDNGYCCSFNHVDKTERRDAYIDAEVRTQEEEFEYLQKAVWDYTDRFREEQYQAELESSLSDENVTKEPPHNNTGKDSYSCARTFGDDLFPGICHYINKCRIDPTSCRLIKTNTTTSNNNNNNTSGNNNSEQSPEGENNSMDNKEEITLTSDDGGPLRAAGAGRGRGLTLMLDTLRCDTVPTDSFKGLRVHIHHPESFPFVGEKGFIVGPGLETQLAVTAVDTHSTEAIFAFNPHRRGCFFNEEFPLKYYKEYSRSACIIECETEYILEYCECVPYYSPGNDSVCAYTKMKECVGKAIAQKKLFQFKKKEDTVEDKSCAEVCLPACNETFYDTIVTAATFPNQAEPNMTKILRDAIADKKTFLNDINYVSASISVMRVFFRESSILQYKRDELFTWEDFVSNLGGVMSLCMGFSLLSLIEMFYFFSIRFWIDKRRDRKAHFLAQNIVTGNHF